VEVAMLRAGTMPTMTSKFKNNLASVHLIQGNYKEAQAYYEEALGVLEFTKDRDRMDTLVLRSNLGIVQRIQGEYEAAQKTFEQVLEKRTNMLGHKHPQIADTLFQLCSVHHQLGHWQRAQTLCTRSVEIQKNILGNTLKTAHPFMVLADLSRQQGDKRQARIFYERALALQERYLGPMHPQLATTLSNLGDLLTELGALEDSKNVLDRALLILESSSSTKTVTYGVTLHNVGRLEFKRKHYRKSLEQYRKAVHVFKSVVSAQHPYIGYTFNAMGESYLEEGDWRHASNTLSKALAIRSLPNTDPLAKAQTQFLLAKALGKSSVIKEKRKSMLLAREAMACFKKEGKRAEEDFADVKTWLSKI